MMSQAARRSAMLVAAVFCVGTARSALAGPFTFTTIDFPPPSASAFGISDSGQVVGFYLSNGVIHGFLLSGGIFSTLDPPGSTLTRALGINDSGQVVGQYNVIGASHSFLLSGGIFSTIDFPGSFF